MQYVDGAILIALLCATIGGLMQGFFRAVCSLGGLILGLSLASWNYSQFAALLAPMIHREAIANTIAFLVIAGVVMFAFDIVGKIASHTLHKIGLGCLDRLAGAVFGFFQGALGVTLCILVTVAFFPQTRWLEEARLPRLFFGACYASTHLGPKELNDRVKQGLRTVEEESTRLLQRESGL
jgi:membrane protein required for colicin V production